MKAGALPQVMLEKSFVKFRKAGAAARQEDEHAGEEHAGEHVVYASDLVAALHVTEEEAEEMIFIADLKVGRDSITEMTSTTHLGEVDFWRRALLR